MYIHANKGHIYPKTQILIGTLRIKPHEDEIRKALHTLVQRAKDPSLQTPAPTEDAQQPSTPTPDRPKRFETPPITQRADASSNKVAISIRLDADIVAHLRKSGRGWQTRLNRQLREALSGGGQSVLEQPAYDPEKDNRADHGDDERTPERGRGIHADLAE